MFKKELYGQTIAQSVVINALRGHLTSSNPPKALSMSFHGPPGTVNDYKEELYKIIIKSLQNCERSMFIFDEVDKMPEGVLNVLVPFLDYHTKIKLWRLDNNFINTTKAIYIFLSNTGSIGITQRLLTLWKEGKQRTMTKLQDFENIISVRAFNEKGGFYHSDTIDSNLIDHYVPFLPLEEVHVRECLKKAFVNRGVYPTSEMIKEALSYVTFGPPPDNIYAIAGCKRLEQKVASIIYANKKQTEL
ncbi:PREDICTED: torsin-1A-like [Eufriesea mexicana]|uniref:torsin-1A-like n=1 Tax=Eufriesea mexicana TaxID=516756 RepID=UPI00083C39D7|nr:PREDICTED: torsin-1A-like [Eufriesea mexicana]